MNLSHLVPTHARQAAEWYLKSIRKAKRLGLDLTSGAPPEVLAAQLALLQNAQMVWLFDSDRASGVLRRVIPEQVAAAEAFPFVGGSE